MVMTIHFPTHLPTSASFPPSQKRKKITTVFVALFIHLMKKESSRNKSEVIPLQLCEIWKAKHLSGLGQITLNCYSVWFLLGNILNQVCFSCVHISIR